MGLGAQPGGGGYGVEIFREATEADGAGGGVAGGVGAEGDEEGGYGVGFVVMVWRWGGGRWRVEGVEGEWERRKETGFGALFDYVDVEDAGEH